MQEKLLQIQGNCEDKWSEFSSYFPPMSAAAYCSSQGEEREGSEWTGKRTVARCCLQLESGSPTDLKVGWASLLAAVCPPSQVPPLKSLGQCSCTSALFWSDTES